MRRTVVYHRGLHVGAPRRPNIRLRRPRETRVISNLHRLRDRRLIRREKLARPSAAAIRPSAPQLYDGRTDGRTAANPVLVPRGNYTAPTFAIMNSVGKIRRRTNRRSHLAAKTMQFRTGSWHGAP